MNILLRFSFLMFSNKCSHALKKLIVHVITYVFLKPIILHTVNYWMGKILAFREPFWSLFAETFFKCGKLPRSTNKFLWKFSLFVEIFIVKKFLDYGKIHWLWKNSTIDEKFLDFGNLFWLWKNSLIMEKFLDCGKLAFLTIEKIIDPIILKPLRHIFWFYIRNFLFSR